MKSEQKNRSPVGEAMRAAHSENAALRRQIYALGDELKFERIRNGGLLLRITKLEGEVYHLRLKAMEAGYQAHQRAKEAKGSP